MKRHIVSKIFFISLLAGFVACFALGFHQELLRKALESMIDYSAREFSAGETKIEKAFLDRNLKLKIENLKFILSSDSGPIPITIRNIDSKNPVYHVLKPNGLDFEFRGAHFDGSSHIGIDGQAKIREFPKWLLTIHLNVIDIGLEELVWLNADNLKGSTGKLSGIVQAGTDYKGSTNLEVVLAVKDPGGFLQGKFFGLLRPYLPTQASKEAAFQLASLNGLVRYKTAELHLNTIRSNQLKVILKMLVPDYNLNLNINMLIRLDEQNSFTDLAQLMGIVKAS